VVYYVGILDGGKNVWGVRIPDVPGCHGGGGTPEDAIADAIGALREVAAHRAANDVALPAPRSVREIMKDEAIDLEAAESLVMIPLLLDRGRSVKANISLDAGLLEAIDSEAERSGLTRSSFLASAAVEKMEGGGTRTTHRRSKNTKLYAVRDRNGKFKDVQNDKRAQSANIRRKKER
jgi:predicted RNase H-like HicB family nuclease